MIQTNPTVTIIIASEDHTPNYEDFFYPLIKQDVDPSFYEIIFVDSDGKTDYQPVLDKIHKDKHPNLNFHFHKPVNATRAKANNYGIRNSKSEIIIFLGDDMVTKTDFVRQHYDFHQKNSAHHIVGVGPALFSEKHNHNNHFAWWAEKSGNIFGISFDEQTTDIPNHFFYLANSSIKRSFLEKTSLFDEDFIHNSWDDYELGLRLLDQGMISKCVPQAATQHHHSYTLQERCDVVRMSGGSAKIFEPKHPTVTNWKKPLQTPIYKHRIEAIRCKILQYLLFSEKYRIKYYLSKLNIAFCEGYAKHQ